jgi:hypothetical protein
MAAFPNKLNLEDTPLEQYSVGRAILLHLLPGTLATGVYILTVPLFTGAGYPSLTALYLPMILAVMILELGYLFYQAQKKDPNVSFWSVLNYREPIPW